MNRSIYTVSVIAIALLATVSSSLAQVKFKYRPFDEEYFSFIQSKIHASEMEKFRKSECSKQCTDCVFLYEYAMRLDSSFLQSDTSLQSIKNHMSFELRIKRVKRQKKDFKYNIYGLHITDLNGQTVASMGYNKNDFICGEKLDDRINPQYYNALNDFILSKRIKNIFYFFEGSTFFYLEGYNGCYYLLKPDRDSIDTLRESSVSELIYWSFFDEALYKKKQEENEP